MWALMGKGRRESPVRWLTERLLPPEESLPSRILGEARRQGLKVVDRSAGAMLRLSFCVARRAATEPLPLAVARCLGQKAGQFAPRRLGRKRYRKSEVLEELRRQQVDLTDASAGWMLRFMACVSAGVLSRSLPESVQSCLLKQMGRRFRPRWSKARVAPPRLGRSERRQPRTDARTGSSAPFRLGTERSRPRWPGKMPRGK